MGVYRTIGPTLVFVMMGVIPVIITHWINDKQCPNYHQIHSFISCYGNIKLFLIVTGYLRRECQRNIRTGSERVWPVEQCYKLCRDRHCQESLQLLQKEITWVEGLYESFRGEQKN